MRGKGLEKLAHERRRGITPAYAGKRLSRPAGFAETRNHPRLCGEKDKAKEIGATTKGSPPPVRGKDALPRPLPQKQGITPAYAGKRKMREWIPSACRDHPRVCGEKLPSMSYSVVRFGSLPHMRGKEPSISRPAPASGITPACAGKSSIQHLTASLGEFEVQKGHPVPHLRQRLQVWPDHARHLRHGLILHASRSAGQGRRLCPGPCPDTAGSGTPRGPSPAKHPHRSPPAATPGGCRAWQSGATAPGSR